MTIHAIARTRNACRLMAGLAMALASAPSHASMFQGEALDTAANVLSWVVLVVVPIVGIVVFWLVHILPEKIAEQKKHPQAKAIQTLCLLSLVFGGLLWPIAWLWAYSKPVLYKMAYGTDVHDEHAAETGEAPAADAALEASSEIALLRERLVALETRLGQEARG